MSLPKRDLRRTQTFTRAEKAELSRYHKILFGYVDKSGESIPGITSGRDVRVKRTKTKREKDNLEKGIYGASLGLPKLKGVIVDKGARVKKLRGEIILDTPYLRKRLVRFRWVLYDGGDLSEWMVGECKVALKTGSEKAWQIQVNEGHLINEIYTREGIVEEVGRKASRYLSHVQKWFMGVIGLTYKSQASRDEYVRHTTRVKNDAAKAREARRKSRERKRANESERRKRRKTHPNLGKRADK